MEFYVTLWLISMTICGFYVTLLWLISIRMASWSYSTSGSNPCKIAHFFHFCESYQLRMDKPYSNSVKTNHIPIVWRQTIFQYCEDKPYSNSVKWCQCLAVGVLSTCSLGWRWSRINWLFSGLPERPWFWPHNTLVKVEALEKINYWPFLCGEHRLIICGRTQIKLSAISSI